MAILIALAPVSSSAVNPDLRVVTTVVNIAVPAGAFDPATGVATITIPGGLVLRVNSSKNWSLQVRALSPTFTYSSPPASGSTKPVAELQLQPVGGGSALALSTSNRVITSGAKTKSWADCAFDVILQATSADPGGLYTATLEFKIY
jgi:hypothetical protein